MRTRRIQFLSFIVQQAEIGSQELSKKYSFNFDSFEPSTDSNSNFRWYSSTDEKKCINSVNESEIKLINKLPECGSEIYPNAIIQKSKPVVLDVRSNSNPKIPKGKMKRKKLYYDKKLARIPKRTEEC